MPTTVATRIDGLNDPPFSAPNTNLTLLPVAAPATVQRILAVVFRSTDGRSGARSAAVTRSWRRSTGHGNAARTTRAGNSSAGKTCMATRNESRRRPPQRADDEAQLGQ